MESHNQSTYTWTDADRIFLNRVYQDLRVARLMALYYEDRLKFYRRADSIFEVSIAIGATSSGVAGWALWSTESGKFLWGIISAAASIAAILKPIYASAKKIELATRQHSGWHALYFSYDKITFRLSQEQKLSPAIRLRYDELLERKTRLGAEDEKNIDHRLLVKIQERVELELPEGAFWIPECFRRIPS